MSSEDLGMVSLGHWLHSYDPRRMDQVQGALLEEEKQ